MSSSHVSCHSHGMELDSYPIDITLDSEDEDGDAWSSEDEDGDVWSCASKLSMLQL